MRYNLVLILLILSWQAKADEGMWLPSLLNKVHIEKMHSLGSELSVEEIYSINTSSLKDAIVSINNGSCTGELVSDEGLFFTNHHCGYTDIQKHSTEENNLLRDGFWAKTKEKELPNEGKTVSFLIAVEDVSDQVLAGFSSLTPENVRADSIRLRINRIVASSTQSSHYNAVVKSFFADNQYLLFITETYRDVRLVFAPPHSIGKFGGDTDNWMWPRHTGDFSLYRIYAGPNGKPANYSEDNIPLKSRHFLPISLDGYKEGDFAMVLGYPGSTDRFLSSGGVAQLMESVNDARINVRKAKLDIIRAYMQTSEKATIQYSDKKAKSSNYYKYSIGQNTGLENLKVVDRKKATELEFENWVAQSEERQALYGKAISLIDSAYLNKKDNIALAYINEAFLNGPEIISRARLFEVLARRFNRGSGDVAINRTAEGLRNRMIDFFDDYNAQTDMKVIAALTKIYAEKVDPVYHPSFIKDIETRYNGDYEKWAAKLFKKSFFDTRKELDEYLKNPKAEVLFKDPIFQLSREVYDMRSKVITDDMKDESDLDLGYRLYVQGLMTMKNDSIFYPDANSTLRLTYGTVGGYSPRNGVEYSYYTTLKGYIEKEIPGDMEFDVSPRLKELYLAQDFGEYADEDGTLHTCFTTNNDITGGNSGSPVINSKGQLIGIAFDGNWEAMSGDVVYEPKLQKCINVDIRFVLWVIDRFTGASNLINELTLVK